jgi:hypothetical protein
MGEECDVEVTVADGETGKEVGPEEDCSVEDDVSGKKNDGR